MGEDGTGHRGRRGPREGSALVRLTVAEVWLVRALLPVGIAAALVGGTAGAVTLVQFAATTEARPEPAATVAVVAAAPDPMAVEATTEVPEVGGAPTEDASGLEVGPVAVEDPTDAAAEDALGTPDYAAILSRRFPGAEWSLSGNDPDLLLWFAAGAAPSRAELDAMWPAVARELEAERSAAAEEERVRAAARAAELAARTEDPATGALVDLADPLRIFGATPDYASILSRRYPGAEWSLNANDPDQLVWLSDGTAPTRAELDALWAEVARERALELPDEELARWAGTSEEAVYVDGALRPRGWVGGADDPQPPGALAGVDPRLLPQLAPSRGGSPVGSLDVIRDPTGGQNFEQRYGMSLSELGDRIAAAHGYWGGSHNLGLSLNGEQTLMWYSDDVDPELVAEVLAGIGAVEPAAEEPAVEDPAAAEPATDAPAAPEPAADEPAVEEVAAEEPQEGEQSPP